MSAAPVTHAFKQSLRIGAKAEARLDRFFATWYAITPATHDEQRKGIDRWFVARAGCAHRIAVEYKSDARAGQTGNAFVETHSVVGVKAGWAYTSEAHFLIYRVEEPETIYAIPMPRLRAQLRRWERQHPQRDVQNEGWVTKGLLVPLAELERIAEAVW